MKKAGKAYKVSGRKRTEKWRGRTAVVAKDRDVREKAKDAKKEMVAKYLGLATAERGEGNNDGKAEG